jgi:hypothetical protein
LKKCDAVGRFKGNGHLSTGAKKHAENRKVRKGHLSTPKKLEKKIRRTAADSPPRRRDGPTTVRRIAGTRTNERRLDRVPGRVDMFVLSEQIDESKGLVSIDRRRGLLY